MRAIGYAGLTPSAALEGAAEVISDMADLEPVIERLSVTSQID